MANIAVIGSGGWGTAVAIHLDGKGYDVTLWSLKQEECDNILRDGENK